MTHETVISETCFVSSTYKNCVFFIYILEVYVMIRKKFILYLSKHIRHNFSDSSQDTPVN